MFTFIKDFISYWYLRYLLVTELYMVEKWERAMFHIVIFMLMVTAYIFNTTVILALVRMTSNSLFASEDSKGAEHINTIIANNYDL